MGARDPNLPLHHEMYNPITGASSSNALPPPALQTQVGTQWNVYEDLSHVPPVQQHMPISPNRVQRWQRGEDTGVPDVNRSFNSNETDNGWWENNAQARGLQQGGPNGYTPENTWTEDLLHTRVAVAADQGNQGQGMNEILCICLYMCIYIWV